MNGNVENRKKFYCEKCDYTTVNKFDFTKHQTTRKHLSNDIYVKSAIIFDKNIAVNFSCTYCHFNTSNKNHYNKHLLTQKHLGNIHTNKNTNTHICDYCNKEYMNYNALWKHKKKCVVSNQNTNEMNENPEKEPLQNTFISGNVITKEMFTPQLFMEVLKQSKELQEVLVEQNKELQNKLLEKENELQTKLLEQNEQHHKEIIELTKKQTTLKKLYKTSS